MNSFSSSDCLPFLRSFLFNPKGMGAIAPSSPKLSRFIASRVGPGDGPILEIGAGTGAITEALLESAVDPTRLFLVERDPTLAALLRQKFPQVRVRCDDALYCRRILSEHAISSVQTIVSSLPLRNFKPAEKAAIIKAMSNALTREGELLQYTYAPACPIPARRFGLDGEFLGTVWQNMPPASVWRFTKRH